MRNKILTALIILCFAACKNKSADWISNYQHVKCEYAKTQMLFDADTLNTTKELYANVNTVQIQINKIETPYLKRIGVVEEKAKLVKENYFTEYRRISAEQNKIYGHQSTPGYDKKIEDLDQKQKKELDILFKQRESINKELYENINYIDLVSKLNQLLTEIESAKAIVKEKYQPTFDSLQNLLNGLNKQFKTIILNMEKEDEQKFTSQRDDIRKSPCEPQR